MSFLSNDKGLSSGGLQLSDMKVSILTDTLGFKSLKYEWGSLHQKSNSNSIFLSWEWLFTWWSTFNIDFDLNIIVVRDGAGELVGLGPFCIRKRWHNFPLKELAFLGASDVSSEYLDILSCPDSEAIVSNAVFETIHRHKTAWGCVNFSEVLETSLVNKYIKPLARKKNYTVTKSIARECSILSLADTKEAVLAGFSGQLKSTIKRRSRKLEGMGGVISYLEDENELDLYISNLFALHQKRWNAVGIKGNFGEKSIQSFHSEVSRLFLKRSLLKIYTLTIDGNVIAALYTFEFKGVMFYFQSGYDPEWSKLSPGTVLMWRCICDAIDRDVTHFDYLRGLEYYKSLWADKVSTTYSILFIPPERGEVVSLFNVLNFVKKMKLAIKKFLP